MNKNFYNKTFTLEIWGDYACFTRPEMKVERVSYDIITPSAARAIFEAIFWKPAIRWNIKKIEVLAPIKWISVKRNEVGTLMSTNSNGIFIEDNRQQKSGLFLRDVKYKIYAELEFIPVAQRPEVENPVPSYLSDAEAKNGNETNEPKKDENPGKYNAIFERRAKKGQCFNRPYLGCREFSCMFRLIDENEEAKTQPINETRDLGFMLYDIDFTNKNAPNTLFYRAKMEKGVVFVPDRDSKEVLK